MNHRPCLLVGLILLLTAALAGLLVGSRPIVLPRVPDESVADLRHVDSPACHEGDRAVRVAAPRRPYDLVPGERVVLSSAFRVAITTCEGARRAATTSLAAEGPLEITCVASRGSELVLQMSMPNANCGASDEHGNSRAADELARDLLAGCFVRIDRSGGIHGHRFPTNVDPRQRNLLRTWFATTRVPLAGGDVAAWSCTEAAPDGAVLLRCERTFAADGALVVVWRRETGAAESCGDAEVHGHGRLQAHATAAWWSAIDVVGDACTRLPGALAHVRATFRATHRLTAVEHADTAPFDWNGHWATVDGADEVAETNSLAEREWWLSELRDAVLEVEIDRLATELAASGDSGEVLARRERLEWLLRLHPEQIERLAATIRHERLDERLLANLAAALAGAGNAAAQRALLDLVDCDQLAPRDRTHCLCACFQIDRPTATTIAAALRLSQQSVDHTVADTSLLLLGAFARTAKSGSTDTMAKLLEQGPAAVAAGRLHVWLGALGNTGSPAVLQVAAPYLHHEDPMVRSAAVSALRHLDTPETVGAIAQHGLGDHDAIVRETAVRTLVQLNAPAVRGLLLQALGDADENVRLAVVQAIELRADVRGCRVALERTSAEDRSSRVRAAAATALRQADTRS